MKKLIILYMVAGLLFFCKKDHATTPSQSITGTLHYSDPAVDGPGLFYETDASEPLLFKNEFSDLYTQYLHYKEFVGLHTRLIFVDHGENGCSQGMIPCSQQHPMRLVEVVKLENE